MATISITVSAAQATRITAALRRKYPEETALTDSELAKKYITDILKHEVYEQEFKDAHQQVAILDF